MSVSGHDFAAAPAPEGAEAYEVKAITSVDDWHGLREQWDRLLRETPGHKPLQSFDFLHTWWMHMGGGRRLWILAFFDGARLAGIAPLQVVRRPTLGRPRRVVQFIGMTEDILLPTLLFPAAESALLCWKLTAYLAENAGAWDRIELDELASGDRAADAFQDLARRHGLLYRSYDFHDCPYLDLSAETPESFWRKRSRKLLKNVRAGRRKLERLGPVTVETFESPADVQRGYDAFESIEGMSWKRKARIGLSSDSRYGTFYRALLEVFARRHAARVMILTLGEQPIAGTFAIAFDGVYCSLQIAHDERYAACSPGTLLEYYELEALLESGAFRRYEFLGGALRNKLRWTSDRVQSVCISAAKPNLAERLADLYAFEAKPRVKQILRAARGRVSKAASRT